LPTWADLSWAKLIEHRQGMPFLTLPDLATHVS